MNHRQKRLSARRLALAALLCMAPIQGAWAAPAPSPTAPTLGTASDFAVLGGAAVTCNDSTITGTVGSLLAPPSVIPTPTCTINGVTHEGDAAAIQATTDFRTAWGELNVMTCPRPDAAYNLAADLTGLTLSPGVYCIGETALLTGQLILQGSKNAVWIFLADADPSITAIGGSVAMHGGGQPCNVYWQTATNVSLDGTDFLGNILAGSAITFTGVGSSLVGRALAGTEVTATGADITGCNKNGKPHKK